MGELQDERDGIELDNEDLRWSLWIRRSGGGVGSGALDMDDMDGVGELQADRDGGCVAGDVALA